MRGLFRGITPTMLGILPYSGIAFSLNEQGKREIRHINKREPTTVERMQCGAVSGLFAQTLTYPFEVTRRRMQTMGVIRGRETSVSSLGMGGEAACGDISMVNTMRQLLHEQGWRGFFKGVSMNWVKGPVAFSISFTAFDIVQGFMERESERVHRLSR
jgi:solute carrier family 25, member 42